jgi:plastocyanin
MNNKIIIGVVLVVIVIGGLYYFNKKQYQPTQQQPVNQQTATQKPENKVEANAITIENFSFNPSTLTVKQGTKVVWTNKDSATHTIKADTFNSQDIAQGGTFEFTFDKKGSFDYSCGIHPSMKGKVIVESD